MSAKLARFLAKSLASGLSLVIVLSAPGLQSYEAFAQTLKAGQGAALPAGALPYGIGANAPGALNGMGAGLAPLQNAAGLPSLGGLEALQAPESQRPGANAAPASVNTPASSVQASPSPDVQGLDRIQNDFRQVKTGRADAASFFGRTFDSSRVRSESVPAGETPSAIELGRAAAPVRSAQVSLQATPEPGEPTPPAQGSWKAWPSEIWNGAKSSGVMTFRFWARFGLIFDAVLRGKPTDEASKAELPASLLKYPALAMPFVALGYAFAPVAFSLGAAYKLAEKPMLSAYRAVRRFIAEFFPALHRVLRKLFTVLRRFVPFTAGLLTGTVATLAGGALLSGGVLALPLMNQMAQRHPRFDSPVAVGAHYLAQAVSALGVAASYLVGGAFGLVLSVPFALTLGLYRALDVADIRGPLKDKLGVFAEGLQKERAPDLLSELDFHEAGKASSALGAKQRAVRLLSFALRAPYLLPVLALEAAAAYRRAWSGQKAVPERSALPEGPYQADARPLPPVSDRKESPRLLEPLLGLGAGLFAGGGLAYSFALPLFTLTLPWQLGLVGAGAVLGGALGLSVTQFSAWKGLVPSALAFGRDSAASARRAFARLGLLTDGALRNSVPEASGLELPPSKLSDFPMPARPAVLLGLPAALGSFAAGVLLQAASVAAAAAWDGLLELIDAAMPYLRELWDFLKPILRKAVPFAGGFIGGSVAAVFGAGFAGAGALSGPFRDVFDFSYGGAPKSRWTRLAFFVLRPVNFSVTLAAGAAGLAIGAAAGAAIAPFVGFALGSRLAGLRGPRAAFYERWLEALGRSVENVGGYASNIQSDENPSVALRPAVQMGNLVLALPLQAALLPFILARTVERSIADAKNPPAPAKTPSGSPSSGRSKSRPVEPAEPVGWGGAMKAGASLAAQTTRELWTKLGAAVADEMGEPAWGRLHGPLGALLAPAFAAFGGAWNLSFEAARRLVNALDRLIRELLPFLRRVFDFVRRIARRVVPFTAGLAAGAVSGVAFSAGFGAYVLASPYFRYVASERYAGYGFPQWVGRVALRGLAGALGLGFGAAGLAVGLAAALPFALTHSFYLALEWGGIGGRVHRFLDVWFNRTLEAELHGLKQLTSFEFKEPRKDGRLQPMDGWVRLGNILPAAFAAAFALTLGGLVAYGRSLRRAAQELKKDDSKKK